MTNKIQYNGKKEDLKMYVEAVRTDDRNYNPQSKYAHLQEELRDIFAEVGYSVACKDVKTSGLKKLLR
jgi:hypothetical protein